MKEIDRILDQLEASMNGNAWHGPSLFELLYEIDAERAAAYPCTSVHSIWEIVLHLTSTHELVIKRLQGIDAVSNEKDDWPSVTSITNDSWEEDLQHLKDLHLQLLTEIHRLADTELDNPIVEGFSTIYRTLHGVIQHILYHTGQIAILRKLTIND
ncbi:DinB family protein [Falsibacillus albus]|uniref:DinB family protein n=1 Tax=Falsibacillus albus TaxID=2478915 RepID=A0A3L7JW38_9BACI|nr:DinB family protein [Falsibacillus albus]RLQ94329.1 DinB family protein [Falsibacillus albus]